MAGYKGETFSVWLSRLNFLSLAVKSGLSVASFTVQMGLSVAGCKDWTLYDWPMTGL